MMVIHLSQKTMVVRFIWIMSSTATRLALVGSLLLILIGKHTSIILTLNELNTTYLWHCHLGHIGHKRMKKLHRDGLLTSFDFESFDTCEACLMGK